MPTSVAAPRAAKRPPLKTRNDLVDSSDGEEPEEAVADMSLERPYYFVIRDAFVGISEGKESLTMIRKLWTEIQKISKQPSLVEKFFQEVRHFALYSIVVSQREPVVEKTIKFVAGLVTYPAGIKDNQRKDKENDESAVSTGDSSMKNDNPLLPRLLNFALDNHDAADKTIRFRLCQIVNLCLESLGEEAELDDDLYDRLLEKLLKRCRDKSPYVRQQACLALHRLQDPTDKECQVINIFKFLMPCDPVAEVRRQITSLIALTSHTLPELIKRTRDCNELVRKTTFVTLSEKVGLKGFSIQKRIDLLKRGFQDTPRVKAVVENKLLMAWLRFSQNDKIKFLKYLDVEEEPELLQKVLYSIFQHSQSEKEIDDLIQEFKTVYVGEDCLIPLEKLDPEIVFYWRHLACYLRRGAGKGAAKSESATSINSAEEEIVDVRGKLLPESPAKYTNYVVTYLEKLKTNPELESEEELDEAMTLDFTCQQLLEMIGVYDWSLFPNERKALEDLLRSRIVSSKTPLPVIPALLTQWRSLIQPGVEIDAVTNMLAEIQAPMSSDEVIESAHKLIQSMTEAKAEVAMAHMAVVEIEDAIEAAVAARDFKKAQQLEDQLGPLKTDYEEKKKKLTEAQEDRESIVPPQPKITSELEDQRILLHCLTILADTLEKTKDSVSKKEILCDPLKEMEKGLILIGVTCHSPAVRTVAIKCLGLLCLFSKSRAQKHCDLFFQAVLLDSPAVKVVAMQAIFDCLLVYGFAPFSDAQVGDEANGEDPASTPQRADDEDEDEKSGTDKDSDKDENKTEDEEEDSFQDAYELNGVTPRKTVGDKSRFIRRRKKTKRSSVDTDEKKGSPEKPEKTKYEGEEMSSAIMSVLVGYLDFDSPTIREVTVLGFAKLLLHDRIFSGRLLSRLVLMWFNPTAIELQKYLSIFLEKYAAKSQEHQEALLESFFPTLYQISEAPATSPLSKISIDKVCALLIRLMSGQLLNENRSKAPNQVESPVHETLAPLIANEILKRKEGPMTRPLLTALNQLQLSTKNVDLLESLDSMARQIVDIPKEAFTKRTARKFQTTIDQLLTIAKEAAAGPALDDSVLADNADATASVAGEENVAQQSVNSATPKTAANTPGPDRPDVSSQDDVEGAASAEDPTDNEAPINVPSTPAANPGPSTEAPASPVNEPDVEPADMEHEDEEDDDEEEEEEEIDVHKSRVRRALKDNQAFSKILADDDQTSSSSNRAATRRSQQQKQQQQAGESSDSESSTSTTSRRSGASKGEKTMGGKHKHSPSTPGSNEGSGSESSSTRKKPAKKKRKKGKTK